LDKAPWEIAPELPFHLLNGGTPRAPGFAKLLYNDKGIYIGVYCQDKNAGQNACKILNRDGTVWSDPSIEIFIDPQFSRTNYYHLALNQAGVQFDARDHDGSWNCAWKAVTYTGDGYWSAEIFLPFGEMGIDGKVGEWWGINICANNITTKENTCWSPTFAGFHTPDRFGKVLIDNATLTSYRLYVNSAEIQTLPSGDCTLAVLLVNATDTRRLVELQADIKDDTGKTIKSAQRVDLPASSAKKFYLGKLKIGAGARVPCSIILKSIDEERTINSSARMLTVAPVMEVTAQYDRYTVETELLAKVRLNLSTETVKNSGLLAQVSGSNGVLLSEKLIKLPAGEIFVKVPGVDKLTPGDYVLSVKCLNEKGKCLASAEDKFQKLEPALHEVKTDRLSRIASLDGKPFIPLGFGWNKTITLELLQYLAANGSNAITVFLPNQSSSWSTYLRQILDDAKTAGLKVQAVICSKDKEQIGKLIREFKDHPAVLAWQMFDEVFCTEWGRSNYETVSSIIKESKEIDAYHMVGMNDNEYGLSYLKSKNLDFPGDIVHIDYYPYPPSGNIAATADYVNLAQEIGRKDSKPSWIYLFSSGYAFYAPREFTPAEQEYSTYLSLISGANGFFYFAAHPKSKSNWDRICSLMREITELTPAIASPLETPAIGCSSPVVKFMVRKYNGALYLIAVNGSKEAVTVTFDLSCTAPAAGAEVVFEGRGVVLKNNALADNFAGYQRHVYRIDLK
ncbi:MAG: sugar-binding protein, partial [bacterium]|nr:sugar-binding protein [bacterium]